MKWLLLSICLLIELTGSALTLEPGTPVFERPSHESSVRVIVQRELDVTADSPVLYRKELHPLARYFYFYPIRFEDGLTGYVDPGCYVASRQDGKPGLFHRRYFPLERMLLGGGIAMAWGMLLLRWRRLGDAGAWRWIAAVVLVRVTLLWLVIQGAGNIVTALADEHGYFGNAISFWNKDFSESWHFTVGQSILYLPFIWLGGARMTADLLVPFSYLSGFVFAPLCLVLGFLIAERLTGRRLVAVVAMMLWAVMPFFYHHLPNFAEKYFISFWDFPSVEFTFAHYVNLIAVGFNAMSDTPSTLMVLLTIYLALQLPLRWWGYGVLGAAFAFGCMLRINNIVFVPLIALVLWSRDSGALRSWKFWGRSVLPGVMAFLIFFSSICCELVFLW